MSVTLEKGQNISLTSEGGLKRVMVGLGWDKAQRAQKGLKALFSPKPQDIDCDAAAILLGENGKLLSDDINRSCFYFGNLRHLSGAIIHQGDNFTGKGEGDDERIMVDLTIMPQNVFKLVFAVNIYDADIKKQHFGMIKNAFIRVVDLESREEICRYNLTNDYSGVTGVIVGEISRGNSGWTFNAIGQGVSDASRLSRLIEIYK